MHIGVLSAIWVSVESRCCARVWVLGGFRKFSILRGFGFTMPNAPSPRVLVAGPLPAAKAGGGNEGATWVLGRQNSKKRNTNENLDGHHLPGSLFPKPKTLSPSSAPCLVHGSRVFGFGNNDPRKVMAI